MADGFVQVAPDSTGKKIDNTELTVGVNTVERQRINIADPTSATAIATVSAAGALKVDGSAVTQPVSAASLPLPTGAATAAKQPALGTAGTASADVISIQGIASMTAVKVDGSAVTQPVSGTVTGNQGTAAATSGAWPIKVTDGTNVSAVKAASTAAAAADPAVVVAVSPNNTVAVTESGTWTVQPGNTQNTTAWKTTDAADAATGSAVPATAIFTGARAATANPSNATGGNTVGLMADKAGRLVVTDGHVRDLVGMQTTTISASVTETTIVTAGAAGVFNDITTLVITNSGTAAATWSLRDATAGTVRAIFDTPATAGSSPIVIPFNPPLPQTTAANNWTLQASTATSTGVHVFAQFIKNT